MGAPDRWSDIDDVEIRELLSLCDQHWGALADRVDAKVNADAELREAWDTVRSASGWPTRARVRACGTVSGRLVGPGFMSILRDCGRCFSRADLGFAAFSAAVQIVMEDVTSLLVSLHGADANRLTRSLHTAQQCASLACVLMVRESTADRELELAEQQRQLAEAETKFARLWESGLLGVLVCDFHGNIRQANEGLLKTFGYTQEDLLSGAVRWSDMTPPEWKRHDEDAIAQLASSGRTLPWEKEYFHKDGSRIPVLVGVSMLNEEETIAFVLDITERKHLEILRHRSMELEVENRRVQESNRIKGEFLANMSHELRTPLNGIIGFAELLLDPKIELSAEEREEFLCDILNCGHHLRRLISDVLDLAKVEAGKIEFLPERTDVERLVEEVFGVLRGVAREKKLSFHATVESSVKEICTDPGRLKQVLYNYLSNALKFTEPGGSIELRILEADDDRFRLEVTDNGLGIEASDIKKLFKEFQQLDSGPSKRHGGTGLGLALTKRLVEAQGGSVGVESVRGKGSTFYAVLPRHADTVAIDELTPPAEVPADAHRVLVVEDDAQDRGLLVRILSEAGYRTVTVGTGNQAMTACRAQTFDAITLDLLLPDMTGLEVLQQLRQVGQNRDTPVVIVSIVAEKGVVRGFPVHNYLAKPIDRSALLNALRHAIRHSDQTGTILVVDDDPASQRLMQAALSSLACRVVCVDDGQAALEFSVHTTPIGIVLDLMMPRMDGFEFLDRFRHNESHRDVPIIVWTTKDLSVKDREILKQLAQGTVFKGEVKPAGLVAELAHLITQSRAQLLEATK